MKNFLKMFLAGIGIGIGAAIPGVSGAAIAVIFKVYELIINAVNNIRKDFKKSIWILIPVLIGIICAVIPCVIIFRKALEGFVFGLLCIFAGLLIGSFPGITDEVKGIKITKKYVIYMVIGFIFVIGLGIASVFLGKSIDIDNTFNQMPIWLYFVLIPVGVIAAVALTIPGLSGSLLLLIIGFYKPLLKYAIDFLKNGRFGEWILMIGCFGIGVLIGVVLVSKIMNKLLTNHRTSTYFFIIGFVLGSIGVLFFNYDMFNYYCVWTGQASYINGVNPWLPIYLEMPIGFALLAICAFGSYQLVKLSRKNQNQAN